MEGEQLELFLQEHETELRDALQAIQEDAAPAHLVDLIHALTPLRCKQESLEELETLLSPLLPQVDYGLFGQALAQALRTGLLFMEQDALQEEEQENEFGEHEEGGSQVQQNQVEQKHQRSANKFQQGHKSQPEEENLVHEQNSRNSKLKLQQQFSSRQKTDEQINLESEIGLLQESKKFQNQYESERTSHKNEISNKEEGEWSEQQSTQSHKRHDLDEKGVEGRLKNIYQFFCKKGQSTASLTFDMIAQEALTMTPAKLVQLCNGFGLYSERVTSQVVREAFKKVGNSRATISFEQFQELINILAACEFPDNSDARQNFYHILSVDNEQDYRRRLKLLKIPFVVDKMNRDPLKHKRIQDIILEKRKIDQTEGDQQSQPAVKIRERSVDRMLSKDRGQFDKRSRLSDLDKSKSGGASPANIRLRRGSMQQQINKPFKKGKEDQRELLKESKKSNEGRGKQLLKDSNLVRLRDLIVEEQDDQFYMRQFRLQRGQKQRSNPKLPPLPAPPSLAAKGSLVAADVKRRAHEQLVKEQRRSKLH